MMIIVTLLPMNVLEVLKVLKEHCSKREVMYGDNFVGQIIPHFLPYVSILYFGTF